MVLTHQSKLLMNNTNTRSCPPIRPSQLALRALAAARISLLALLVPGCQVLTYTGPNGEHFQRSSFAANVSIASLSIEADTNQLKRLELRGYQIDSTQALGVVT